MDHAAFHVVYADKRVSANLDGRYLREAPCELPSIEDPDCQRHHKSADFQSVSSEILEVRDNLSNLLSSFHGVHICASANSCMTKLFELDSNDMNAQPAMVILEAAMALEARQASGQLSEHHYQPASVEPASLSPLVPSSANQATMTQNTNLLRMITSHTAQSRLSTLIVPLAFIELPEEDALHADDLGDSNTDLPLLPQIMLNCMENGAVDVLFSPLSLDRMRSIASHAYRVRMDKAKSTALFQEAKKARKRSWVGIDDRKPFAYLREEMVSGLMTGICSPEDVQSPLIPSSIYANPDDDLALIKAFTSWSFSAHEFSEDQLVHAATLMLQHVLTDLQAFLLASQAAYNSFVHYHNFRHVIDVMQAIFYFLIRIGTIPPYPNHIAEILRSSDAKSPIGSLLQPFDALTLLISAIGHDVGHPGVNNAFLVALNAPLAQLYNDKSVLESFHCAAYSQILRRYWKSAFADTAMRGLMINSILATDMGLHFKYMTDLGNLQEKVYHNEGINGLGPQVLDEYRTLTCGLLIKCADISNVARQFDVAAKWADILQLEFANQGAMESDLGMPTTLFGGPPELGDLTKLANSQNGFMKIFACPLFEAVSDILPCMTFAVDEMRTNQAVWKQKIQEQMPTRHQKQPSSSDNLLSPDSGSPSRSSSQPELSHPEGLPASQIEPSILTKVGSSTGSANEESRRLSAAPTVPRTSDRMSQVRSQESKRSSRGVESRTSNPAIDPEMPPRRSSNGFLVGYNLPQSLVGRRSSNTSPSQLQMGLSSNPNLPAFPTVSAAENVQPSRRGSEGTGSQTNTFTLTNDTGNRNIAIFGGGGSSARKGSKSSDSGQTYSQQRSTTYAVARNSPYSTHERHSSGGHTSRSQSVPYSPTETQATSVTEDSDDKGHQLHERGGSSTITEGIPEMFDADKPGAGHRFTGSGMRSHPKAPDVKTSVLNGGGGVHHSHTDRLVSRKSSRFLNFLEKEG